MSSPQCSDVPTLSYAPRSAGGFDWRRCWRRARWVLGGFLALVAACSIYASVPVRRHVQQDGWVLDFHHSRVACSTCSARLDRLECRGKPVPAPILTSSKHMLLVTPVGYLQYHSSAGYRPNFGRPLSRRHAENRISEDELARGYYDVSRCDPWSAAHELCKVGTPKHWCLGISDEHARWLDPAALAKLEW